MSEPENIFMGTTLYVRNDIAQARIAELEEKVKFLTKYDADVDGLMVENKRLKEALINYGHHVAGEGCIDHSGTMECHCGFTQILNELCSKYR